MRNSVSFFVTIVAVAFLASPVHASGNYSDGYVVDGTNTWVGPATGGSWSNVNNWVASSPSNYTVEELFARHCFYDLSSLQNGAVMSNDVKVTCIYETTAREKKATKSTMVFGMKFDGAVGDTWKIVRAGGVGFWTCRNCLMEITGGTLEWRDTAPTGNNSYPVKSIKKYGSGTLRLVGYAPTWETDNTVYEGTLAYTNNLGATNMGHLLNGNTASLCIDPGQTNHIAGVGSSSSYPSATIDIGPGALLHLGNGWNTGSIYKFYGSLLGSGTLRLTGGRRQEFLDGNQGTVHSFTGTLDPWLGELVFGTAAKPRGVNADARVLIQGGGWVRNFADQTYATISGEGVDGGIDFAAGKSLTVGGVAVATTNVYAGRITGQNFTKTGAGYDLSLTGDGTWTGTTTVEAGCLTLGGGLSRPGLVAYWSFDDETAWGRDDSALGKFSVALRTNPAPTYRPRLTADAVHGKSMWFGDGATTTIGGKFVQTRNSPLKGAREAPNGNDPFTFSFWMKPDKATCGRGSNFIHLDSSGGKCTNELGNVTYGVTWRDGFYFGGVKYDETTPTTSLSAFKNLGFYVGCEWTRNGVWNGDCDSKVNDNKVAIAKFADKDYLFDGKWHHIVGTYGGTTKKIRLYVDGVLMDERTRPSDLSLTSDPHIEIGNYGTDSDHTYGGGIDEVQWLKGEWTAAEVAAEYAARRPALDEFQMVAPVAHWTFDATESYAADALLVRDVTGNGYDLVAKTTNTAYTLAKSFAVKSIAYPFDNGNKALYLAYAGSSLQLRPDVDLGTAIATGGSFTVSLRYSKCMRDPFLVLGTPATADNRLVFQDNGSPAYIGFRIGSATSREFPTALRYELNTTYAAANWAHETIVYDADKKQVYGYLDGKLVYSAGVTFTLKPETLTLNWNGLTGSNGKYQTKANYDDLRLYNVALDTEQVAALAKVLRYADATTSDETALAAQQPIPAASPVTVASGASLRVRRGFKGALHSVSGAGTLDLEGGEARLGNVSAFTGNIRGSGVAVVAAGSTMDLTGAASNTAYAGFENGEIVVDPANPDTPLIKTGGPVWLPTTGTIRFTTPSSWCGSKFLLAECSGYVGPEDTTGWTMDMPNADKAKARFIYDASVGKLYLRFPAGMIILIR